MFDARLVGADGKKITRLDIGTGDEARAFKEALESAAFNVANVEAKPVKRHPYPPFQTSTLQQEASRKLGLAPARTMQLAQRLYEGVDIGGETVGLITYMRTDGVDMDGSAIAAARRVIGKEFGDAYVPDVPRKYTVKAKNAQEAHEAIRPTDLGRLPAMVARHLEPEQARLYELIWKRTIASQMESASLERTTVDIAATVADRDLELRATGQVTLFDGFLTLYQESRDDDEDEDSKKLPVMKTGESLEKRAIAADQHFTEPPPRYSEASLVKRMEELGIGRPSTYAATLSTLRDREYVRIEKKRLVPEDKGMLVTAFLESFFNRYVAFDFTALLEEKLDRVSNAEIDWKVLLREFWEEFTKSIGDTKDLRVTEVLEALNGVLGPHVFPQREDGGDPRSCQVCGTGTLSLKLGKFGAFVGCSNYPECRYTRPLTVSAADGEATAEGGTGAPGVRILGKDPVTEAEVTVRDGRFGPYIQLGEGHEPGQRRPCDGARFALAAEGGREASRERRADPRRHRPLRALRPARQDLRQYRQGRRHPADRRQPRHRPHRRQGNRGAGCPLRAWRRGSRPRSGRASDRRQARGAGGQIRALRQLGQGQRDAAEVVDAGGDHARAGGRAGQRQGRVQRRQGSRQGKGRQGAGQEARGQICNQARCGEGRRGQGRGEDRHRQAESRRDQGQGRRQGLRRPGRRPRQRKPIQRPASSTPGQSVSEASARPRTVAVMSPASART